MRNLKSQALLDELNMEYQSTHTCLESIPKSLFDYKPHPKSMNLGYLALLVAEIPLRIKHLVSDGEIDFVSFKHAKPNNNAELVAHFEDNMEAAKKALKETNDADLRADFTLKSDDQILYTTPKVTDIGVTLNHCVHRRGQLTV